MADRTPTADFQRTARDVVAELRNRYPDLRARGALAAQPIVVFGTADAADMQLAGTYGRAVGPRDVLLGLHVGAVGANGEIRVYEDGIRVAAMSKGITVQDQLKQTLLHEAEHSLGFCPDGHLDCSQAEVTATLNAGGWLSPPQQDAYRQRGFSLTPSGRASAAQGHTADCGCGGARFSAPVGTAAFS